MRHLACVMGAVNKEAPGAHRRQTLLAQLDPVLVGQGLDRDGAAGDARQILGIGRVGIERLNHRPIGKGFFHDQHRLGASVQLQCGCGVGGLCLGQGDTGFPQRWGRHRLTFNKQAGKKPAGNAAPGWGGQPWERKS